MFFFILTISGRQPKSIDLIEDYKDIEAFVKPSGDCRCAIYSSNGKYFAYTQAQEVTVVNTTTKAVERKLDISDSFDIRFSPNGNYLCIWCKPILLDRSSGIWTKNIKVINVNNGKTIMEWSNKHQNGWAPQFTMDEKTLLKGNGTKEIEFFDISNTNLEVITGAQYKFKTEDQYQNFHISPGLNPSLAVFIPERSGKPANVSIYNLPNFNQPVCSKNFFKAEKCQLKWNSLGTALLALASTDHDTTNQSYYGETNLYLLGIAGSYNSRIDLNKPGPIHDITWLPTAREFAVSYGYMPSETSFFDARGNLIHSLPTLPRNTILYSPTAKFVLVAGFGNLQGTVDIYDRQNKFTKIVSFEASNTSVCEWSPCGRFILTATTSPRLRVDNGYKLWLYSGNLLYYKEYNELFSIGWKPIALEDFKSVKLTDLPEAHESANQYLAKKLAANADAGKKPSGAYRPPHARNGGSGGRTSLYQREMQSNLSGARTKTIPGAPIKETKESKSAAKNKKKRDKKEEEESAAAAAKTTANTTSSTTSTTPATTSQEKDDDLKVAGGIVSVEEKKIRSLLKKLRAIEALKMKQAYGETLEETQISKIDKEEGIRKDLAALGWSE